MPPNDRMCPRSNSPTARKPADKTAITPPRSPAAPYQPAPKIRAQTANEKDTMMVWALA